MGGVLKEASVPVYKGDLGRLGKYYQRQIAKSNVKLVEENATPETIAAGDFRCRGSSPRVARCAS